MPPRAGPCQQALGASRLNSGAAVGDLETVVGAILLHCVLHHLAPAKKVVRLLIQEFATFSVVGSSFLPPVEPWCPEGVNKEIEETGKAHPHDGVHLTAMAVALHLKAVVEQHRRRQRRGSEGLLLSLLVLGSNEVEMHL